MFIHWITSNGCARHNSNIVAACFGLFPLWLIQANSILGTLYPWHIYVFFNIFQGWTATTSNKSCRSIDKVYRYFNNACLSNYFERYRFHLFFIARIQKYDEIIWCLLYLIWVTADHQWSYWPFTNIDWLNFVHGYDITHFIRCIHSATHLPPKDADPAYLCLCKDAVLEIIVTPFHFLTYFAVNNM